MLTAARPTEFIDVTLRDTQLDILCVELAALKRKAEQEPHEDATRIAQLNGLIVAFSTALDEARANTKKSLHRVDLVKQIQRKIENGHATSCV